MPVTVAQTAGFCFGVDRAVNTVYELLKSGKKAATLGPIIHNPQLVEDLRKRGVKIVESPREVSPGYTLVIRSHGVPESVEAEIEELGLPCVDATCPFVKKIHQLAKRAGEEGKPFLLFGDRDHPEVQGIIGHCGGEYFVLKNREELQKLLENNFDLEKKPLVVAAQTTFHTEEWQICLETLKKVCTNAAVFATICNATAKRQKEARALALKCDRMIVIGGRDSSNTAKLRDICAQYCETYLVETADELPALPTGLRVGITAGASTPASIIKEVLVTMAEVNTNEQNFEEMLEESLKSLNTDEKVHGVVVGISPTEVYVDVGRKQAGFIPVAELSNDPAARPEDLVKLGDEMELLIMKTNDQEGTIMLSKRRVDAMRGWDDIEKAQESGEVLEGKVIEVVKGGVIVLKDAMRIFVPASQATASRGEELEPLKGQEVKFRIIEVNRQRRRAVGSIRSVLRDERKAQQEKFWETVEEGQQFTGKVKSLTSFGAFVDLGGVDGMVHISELSWNRVRHPSEVVNVGDTVDVYIKSLDRENSKISLGYKRPEDNPWVKLEQEYPVGTVCEAKVVGMTQFGAFASVIPGIDGLIHISQIADHRIEKPQDVLKVGDTVTVKITEIDFDRHRVSLSIRALLEEQQAAADEAAAAAPAEEVVYVAGEEAPAEEPEETVEPEAQAASEEPATEEEAPAEE
ncbi:bifunctional 4-hydroxy-3-methylbut-2-enyl diphosphate reductase/30S ribosomal protein S1 [Neglectibacter caecimuris]|uniref:bifunctional 4-hydroxy-3-methylbut-2-enyl diphosphate reductase/30S ribosomal protein S1 n=1 Tax=Neglectibacter caecimuris TaxID=3093658 RepID=UPI002AC8E6D0|nr:bifunctional 4-hydroxy-3-methylbut-2-enyl diphosphate reductase/30S ribosomal protein S1 [Neglectibacter sp. M00184]